MKPEKNPLDLNNLPDDFSRDGKQVFDDTLSSGGASKKKTERGKVYECRFCSLKFCKSQALGGHMNRHRQERETETLNRARQLVFSSDNLAAPPPHLGCHPVGSGGYHPSSHGFGDPYRSVYTPRLLSAMSAQQLPRQPFPFETPHYSSNNYYRGHVINKPTVSYGSSDSSYSVTGAPVKHTGGRDGFLGSQDEGLNWGRAAAVGSQQQPLDPASSFNRFHGGF